MALYNNQKHAADEQALADLKPMKVINTNHEPVQSTGWQPGRDVIVPLTKSSKLRRLNNGQG